MLLKHYSTPILFYFELFLTLIFALTHAMALLEVIGNVATVITIISFLTGLIICRDIYRARSTGDFSSFPFAAGTLCTFLWLRYGLLLADPTMIFVNSIGFTLQTCYLIWFYFYTVQRAAITRQLLLLLSILFSLHFYTRYSAEPEVLVAPFASLSSLLFCASPLASVSEVVRTRSTAKLPFALILSSFVVSSLWFSYGYLLDNSFVMLPNGIGALISGMQLSLFALYPNKSKSQ